MKHRIILFAMSLLLAVGGLYAQKRIKSIDIKVDIPKVGADMFDGTQITGVYTDDFGSQNMLGEDKINAGGVQFFEFDCLGNRAHSLVEAKFEAGREYVMKVSVTNYTDVLFNYKNDKEYTADNTTLKVTINGQPAKILRGSSARPLLCEVIIKMPGERDPMFTNTKVSSADGEHVGYGYVDLGLPSGTLWATCNIGAKKPEEYGDYYAFGETKTKKSYTEKNFIGYGAYTMANPYNIQSFGEEDDKYSYKTSMFQRLLPEYDAATQNMGGEWQIPTRLQAAELRENCYPKFAIVNGVKGTLWISLKNGKSIFTPYAGSIVDTKNEGKGIGGDYQTSNARRARNMYTFTWGTSYTHDDQTGTYMLSISTYQYNEDPVGDVVCFGVPIRAVWGGKEFSGDKAKSGKAKSKVDKGKNKVEEGKDKAEEGIKKVGKGIKNVGKKLFGK